MFDRKILIPIKVDRITYNFKNIEEQNKRRT